MNEPIEADGSSRASWNRGNRFPRRRPPRPRVPWGRFQEQCAPALRPRHTLEPGLLKRADWPELWSAATRQLRSAGLRTGTLRLYRQVLRGFRDFLQERSAGTRPGCATPELAREFLHRFADRRFSWSWTATHISALRTVFDKLGGASITEGIPTPKRPCRLHDVLETEEVGRMLKAAESTRDRLAILLFYGCGLKTSELCGLRWRDVDFPGRSVRVSFAGGTRERKVPLPENAIVLLRAESSFRDPADPVFAGLYRRSPTKPEPSSRLSGRSLTKPDPLFISVRTVERIVRRAAQNAGLTKHVCCTTLRRSYTVQCLRDGMNARELQENLGHKLLETTLDYSR
jgi:integrase/recombinase XerD